MRSSSSAFSPSRNGGLARRSFAGFAPPFPFPPGEQMSRTLGSVHRWSLAVVAAGAISQAPVLHAQAAQKIDQDYTAKIKAALTDSRISTELVDHLPASATVPTPLKFNGRIVGAPGELTHASQIHAYLEAIAKAAPTRARFWKIGKSEEGRDIVLLAIADEKTIASLDK